MKLEKLWMLLRWLLAMAVKNSQILDDDDVVCSRFFWGWFYEVFARFTRIKASKWRDFWEIFQFFALVMNVKILGKGEMDVCWDHNRGYYNSSIKLVTFCSCGSENRKKQQREDFPLELQKKILLVVFHPRFLAFLFAHNFHFFVL